MDIRAVKKLLKKEMDRKEFLRVIGILLLVVLGISGIGKTITTLGKNKPTKGFGAGKYGV